MSENLIQTIKTTLQDVVAPDVKELKVRGEANREQTASLERRMDARFNSTDAALAALQIHFTAITEANTKAIIAAVAQGHAENEVMILRQLANLTERISALESVRAH